MLLKRLICYRFLVSWDVRSPFLNKNLICIFVRSMSITCIYGILVVIYSTIELVDAMKNCIYQH